MRFSGEQRIPWRRAKGGRERQKSSSGDISLIPYGTVLVSQLIIWVRAMRANTNLPSAKLGVVLLDGGKKDGLHNDGYKCGPSHHEPQSQCNVPSRAEIRGSDYHILLVLFDYSRCPVLC